MQFAIRTLVLLLAALYTGAASLPCPAAPHPRAQSEHALAADAEPLLHASHRDTAKTEPHASHRDRAEHSASQLVVSATCLCGCQNGATSKAVPGNALGATLLAAAPILLPVVGSRNLCTATPRIPASPNAGIDPIPI